MQLVKAVHKIFYCKTLFFMYFSFSCLPNSKMNYDSFNYITHLIFITVFFDMFNIKQYNMVIIQKKQIYFQYNF